MLVCGWTARLLLPEATPDAVFLPLLERVLPAGLAALFAAALFASAFSALESILLVMAAAVSVDVKTNPVRGSLDWPKPAVVLAAGLLAGVALAVPEPGFDRLLLAWTLLGSAFGPLLFVRLTGKRVRPGSMLGSMWAGFVLTLLLHMLPSAPGDFLERALPFVAALGIALTGGDRRRNPDRADRADRAEQAPAPAPVSAPENGP
jgi:sodium/proline symporter